MDTKIPQIISFDFDGCLDSNATIRELCRMYIAAGKKVYILTSRSPEVYRNYDLLAWADELGVSRTDVLYAWDTTKAAVITSVGIDVHYDNDAHAVHQINTECGPQAGILVHYTYISNDLGDE